MIGDLLLGSPAAWAHAELLATSPVDGAVVGSAPSQVRLRFSEPVRLVPHSVRLFDASGAEIRIDAAARAAGHADVAVAALPSGLRRGTYVASWRVVSDDSHVVSGAFEFSIGAPSPQVAAARPHPGRVAPALNTVGEGLAFLGMTVAIGGAVLVGVLWPAGDAPRRGRRVVWTGLGALGVGTAVVLVAQYPYTTGGAVSTAFRASALDATMSTRIGVALAARLAITLVLAVVFAYVLRHRDRATAVPALGICALALVTTWTLADHAHTGIQAWLAIPATDVHLVAVAVWLGGLLVIGACVIGAGDRVGSVRPALARFSRLALPCFAVIVLTGLYQAWRQVGSFAALGHTRFGQLLLVKLGCVLAILALASQARRFVRRRAGAVPVRGLVAAEATLGVTVLAVTTVLANTAPARTSYAPPVHARIALAATTHSRLDSGHVEIRLDPARHGVNVADIYLVARDGTLVRAVGVTGELAAGDGSQPITVAEAEPGHYVASSVSIPYAGVWVLQLHVRTSQFDEIPVAVRFRAH